MLTNDKYGNAHYAIMAAQDLTIYISNLRILVGNIANLKISFC